MKENIEEKIEFIKERYLKKKVSFLSGEDEDDEDVLIVGEVVSVTSEGELRIKDDNEGFIYVGTPEDVDLVSDEVEENTETSALEEKEEKTEKEEAVSELETTKEEKKPQQEERKKSVKKVKDQIFAELLLGEGGGTINELTDKLQKEAGGSPVENQYKVKNFLRFLTFLGIVEVEDDLYVLHLK
ncbi:MAG: hypothetical protein ACTSQY_09515 [Candidatus Odinarchaeia archaeon]